MKIELTCFGSMCVLLLSTANCSGDDDEGSGGAGTTSGNGATSATNASTGTGATGGGATCPSQVPTVGSTCSPDALYCEYAGSPCPAAYLCETGTWTDVSLSNCTFPCGDVECFTNELCVQSAGGPGYSYSCEPNPCTTLPFDCRCAGALCGGEPFVCTGVEDRTVICECPQCA